MDLNEFLNQHGIELTRCEHPAVMTVEESDRLVPKLPGAKTKNLFLRDKKGALFLVVALEDAAIELKSLHRLLGASGRFSFETMTISPTSTT